MTDEVERLMRESEAEIMTPVPTDHAFKQAEILAMRNISESLTALTATVGRMAEKQDDIRDRLVRIEAQEFKTSINRLEIEFDSAKVSQELRVSALELALARYAGTFIPLSVLGSGTLSAVAAFVVAHFFGGK